MRTWRNEREPQKMKVGFTADGRRKRYYLLRRSMPIGMEAKKNLHGTQMGRCIVRRKIRVYNRTYDPGMYLFGLH